MWECWCSVGVLVFCGSVLMSSFPRLGAATGRGCSGQAAGGDEACAGPQPDVLAGRSGRFCQGPCGGGGRPKGAAEGGDPLHHTALCEGDQGGHHQAHTGHDTPYEGRNVVGLSSTCGPCSPACSNSCLCATWYTWSVDQPDSATVGAAAGTAFRPSRLRAAASCVNTQRGPQHFSAQHQLPREPPVLFCTCHSCRAC